MKGWRKGVQLLPFASSATDTELQSALLGQISEKCNPPLTLEGQLATAYMVANTIGSLVCAIENGFIAGIDHRITYNGYSVRVYIPDGIIRID